MFVLIEVEPIKQDSINECSDDELPPRALLGRRDLTATVKPLRESEESKVSPDYLAYSSKCRGTVDRTPSKLLNVIAFAAGRGHDCLRPN